MQAEQQRAVSSRERRELCQLTRERAQELARLIDMKLEESGGPSNPPLVLTGGAVKLPGFEDLVQERLSSRVRIGVPNGHVDVPEILRAPEYATSVGLLLWAAGRSGPDLPQNGNGKANNGSETLVSRLMTRLRRLSGVTRSAK
jgi:cell division ATPase FtsA